MLLFDRIILTQWIIILQIIVIAQCINNINVLFINEIDNQLATDALELSLKYMNENFRNEFSVNLIEIEEDKNIQLLEFRSIICNKISKLNEIKQNPHLILDATVTLELSVIIKAIASALSIPTIVASYGQNENLSFVWRKNKNLYKQSFLIKVIPPADTIPEIIRSIVVYQNVTSAAILYDKTFNMNYKYKTLLQNLPTRYIIAPIALDYTKRCQQITKIRNLNIFNYFILGSFESIQNVLGVNP